MKNDDLDLYEIELVDALEASFARLQDACINGFEDIPAEFFETCTEDIAWDIMKGRWIWQADIRFKSDLLTEG